MVRGATEASYAGQHGERHHLPGGAGPDVKAVERRGVLLEPWLDLQHHVMLVELAEDGRDLALAEGVVEGVVDRLRGHARGAPVRRDRSSAWCGAR